MLNVTLTAKLRCYCGTLILITTEHFLTKFLMSTNNHYNFNLVMQL